MSKKFQMPRLMYETHPETHDTYKHLLFPKKKKRRAKKKPTWANMLGPLGKKL